MKLKAYIIRDIKAQNFSNPFYMTNNGVAIRAITDLMRQGNSELVMYPDDKELWSNGEYDTESGEFNPSKLTMISKLAEWKPEPQDKNGKQ